ncbi:MAG TPA: histidinol-phosphatase HisJ family protein [Bacillota bacterium]|nr:histidinol-phosphatase HisJ family protein [Bacillota bacterium]HOK68746.1 histidinol-phosphatase HisJ family protein [Bacillota bacterium]HPP85609.1 histidinol-phosphatase HisJ family protein [Bacillota bacterium]
MMMVFDYHIHSQYSGDIPAGKGSTVNELCEAAIQKGFREIAITDHCDIDGVYYGAFPKLDIAGVYRDIVKARAQYAGRLNILFGIEIGQAWHMPKEAKFLIDRFEFDYVIGSVHSVRGILDFADLKMREMSDGELLALWEKYIGEMKELLDWGYFSTLAHITYPYRYLKFAGRESLIDLEKKGRAYFEDILKKAIEKGVSLEVNTSGLRQGLGQTLPNTDLIKFYKELGGEMITIGSDAHHARNLGADIRETAELLKSLGFQYITRYQDRKPYMQKID